MSRSNAPTPRRSALGFTLLEVIVIIMVGGLLAALVVNLMSTQLLRSSNPASIASDAAGAEALMETLVADYTTRVNGDIATALDTFSAAHPTNSTLAITDTTWNSVRTLTVTTTAGSTSYTTLLTQARTNAADNATDY